MKLTRTFLTGLIDIIDLENNQSNRLTANDKKAKIELWFNVLGEYTKEEVEKAVYEAITNCEFAPRIKNIVDICKRNRNPYTVSPMDLWNEVLNVLPQVEAAALDMSLGNNRAWNEQIRDYGKETYAERGIKKLQAAFDTLRPEVKRYFGDRPSRLARINEMSVEEREFEKSRFIKAVQSFISEQETAAKNGVGDFYELVNSSKQMLTDKSEGEQ